MRTARVMQLCVAAVLLLSSRLGLPTIMETYPVQLSTADREQLENAACRQPQGVGLRTLKAYTYSQTRTASIDVGVECESHGKVEGHPARFDVRCGNSRGRWECESPALIVSVVMGSETVDIGAEEVAWPVAIAIVRDVAAARYMQGEDLVAAVREGPCWVWGGERLGWSVRCGSLVVTVIHPCSGSCAYEVIGVLRAIP